MTNVRRENRVEFKSPGTFFHESTVKPIETWDTAVAAQMAKTIVERHGAVPFGFVFHEVLVADDIPDGEGGFMPVQAKTVRSSSMHYLGGTIMGFSDLDNKYGLTTAQLNMLSNNYPTVIVVHNGYKSTHPFHNEDFIVDPDTGIARRMSKDTYDRHVLDLSQAKEKLEPTL